MSSGGGNGKGAGAGAGGGLGSIPAASRKVVQSLKEIVNCPEAEIYATLRECNMDPNEAVNRLLTQDPFHEVKSKREKKKENKDTTDYRLRGAGNASNRGGRGAMDRRTGSTPYSYSESANIHERPAHRKENGTYSHAAPYSSPSLAPNTDANRHVSSFSDNVPIESKLTTASRGDGLSSAFQPTSGVQSAWGGGTAGQVSMADIVKKGRPQNKAPGPANSAQYGNQNHVASAPPPVLPHHALHPSHDRGLSGSEPESGLNQHKDEWPAIEHPPASNFPFVHAIENPETANLHFTGANHNVKSDDAPLPTDAEEDSMAANMQQLNLENEEQIHPLKEEPRSVVIPDHLQVQSSECLNLSFGSFGPGIAPSLSVAGTSGSLNNEVEEQSETEDASPAVHPDFRNAEYYGEEQVRSATPEDLLNRSGITAETHTSVSPAQPEVLKQDISSEAEGAQYPFHNSLPGYNFDNSHQQQLNTAYAQTQASSQTQNPAPFSNVMAYANLSPGSLLASSVQQPVRESDLTYSQFHANQSMAAKYGNPGAVGGSSVSGAEALEASNISSSQQMLPSANVAVTGPGLPQHLAMHPYSQPALPLGPFTNMISYPFLPQSYTYMPSAFQQAFGGNSSYHQSLAAVLPQYKNNLSVSSLPQSAAVASGYGAFGGSSTNVPGNFSLNQNAAPGGSTMGYDELLSSQYKDHLLSLQQAQLQNDNSAMYAHGNGSRTISGVPANTYYNFQGQNQQPGGFRQNQQQPSQHFGSPGYPNFYHSQSGMSMEHQQQNPRDGSIGGSQVQPSKQSQQQMWQNSY
uniref:GBF-interacting protein 1 N-terminal domain-containing protein n=2 Tax=Kalanchoe fedtschenkoi TaxID=63787 RepID=A0A7N0ZY14_KALFE